jgi:NADPH:quinone reductase-like Zn-dependent oxidoreductase
MQTMKAARIDRFGPPDVITMDDLPRPVPKDGEVLVRVACAGVGPWDAWIRAHKSVVVVSLPLTLGSDISGIVEEVGPGVGRFAVGDHVFGVTNPLFIGGYAEYAIAQENMIAQKPESLDFAAAASAPVVAVTAWQMLFDYARAQSGQSVLILGAAGNVGSYAVQLATQAALKVFATASAEDAEYVRGLGAAAVIDYNSVRLEDAVPVVDLVLDTVGGSLRDSSLTRVSRGGVLVSVVSKMTETPGSSVHSIFFLVDVTSERLDKLSDLFNSGRLKANVGTVLPLAEARLSHEMLEGAPHRRGKIVLRVADLL